MRHHISNTIISIIICIAVVPIILLEYFCFVWFWGGADVFNLFLTPIFYAVYLIIGLILLKKIKKKHLNIFLTLLLVVILPIITMITVYFFAFLFGINIEIA